MTLVTNLSIRMRTDSTTIEILPLGIELKYQLFFETQELNRSLTGKFVKERRDGKVKLVVEGIGSIPDLLRQSYLNSVMDVTLGIRMHSSDSIPEYAVTDSVVRKSDSSSYRTKFEMMISQFSCEYCEFDLTGESGSHWKLILEEI